MFAVFAAGIRHLFRDRSARSRKNSRRQKKKKVSSGIRSRGAKENNTGRANSSEVRAPTQQEQTGRQWRSLASLISSASISISTSCSRQRLSPVPLESDSRRVLDCPPLGSVACRLLLLLLLLHRLFLLLLLFPSALAGKEKRQSGDPVAVIIVACPTLSLSVFVCE